MGIKELKKKTVYVYTMSHKFGGNYNMWSLSKYVNSYLVSMKGNPFSMHLFLIVNAAFNECLLCISNKHVIRIGRSKWASKAWGSLSSDWEWGMSAKVGFFLLPKDSEAELEPSPR